MKHDDQLPRRVEWLIRGFRWYVKRYVRKHFHAIRLSKRSSVLPDSDQPVIIVMNHPSWWDPLMGVVLSEQFPSHEHYAPIDSEMLHRYRVFSKLGFFGVEPGTTRGASIFLRVARSVLARPRAALWVTAQGEFRDVRRRPLDLRAGVGHLARNLDRGLILPLAVEYPFWDERTPEALARWGSPLDVGEESFDPRRWTERIEQALTETQDALAEDAIRRDPSAFTTLLEGNVGIGGSYDWWRRLNAWMRGRRFKPGHTGDEKASVP